MSDRLTEQEVDRAILGHLEAAQQGDTHRARQLHQLLAWCVTERVCGGVQWWLTDKARATLADMLLQLSRTEGSGAKLNAAIAQSVLLKESVGNARDSRHLNRDAMIHAHVRHVLLEQPQRTVGKACEMIARQGIFDLSASTIRRIYHEVKRKRRKV